MVMTNATTSKVNARQRRISVPADAPASNRARETFPAACGA